MNKDVALRLYRTMQRIRQCEEELARCHARGLVHGACHTYVGEEAIAAGVCAHLAREDSVFSTHRGHGHALAKGVTPAELIAELFGRATGCSRGRGGSMHLFQPEVGMMGTSGIVGPCILQAAGAGYSAQLLGERRVGVAFFGDGAVNNGAFHEGLNLAGIWKLPCLFVCENNGYATEVPFAYAAANGEVGARGAIYGMPGVTVDGNDVAAVYRAAGEAVARARAGEGPTLIECRTYRTRAHAEGMADYGYRTREEVDAWRARCPIERFAKYLVESGLATRAELEGVAGEIAAEIAEARAFAERSPWPEPETATTHVYSLPHRPRPAPPPEGARELTQMQATLEALELEMQRNRAIFVLGEGIGRRGGNFRTTAGLYDRFGAARLRDTPIAERGFVGLACGAAMTGARPVVDFMFVDFLLDAVGEVVNQIAKIQYMSSGRLRMPIVLRGVMGIGHSAATHHSGSYLPIWTGVPGLRVAVPSNAYDAKGLFAHALRRNDPCVFLEHREILGVKGPVPEGDWEIPFGVARTLREGRDISVVGISIGAHLALAAAAELEREGVSVEVIDPRTVAPLDVQAIARSVERTGRLLIVDQAFGPCGVGAEIAAQVAEHAFHALRAPIRRINGAHAPTPYSPPLEAAVIPDASRVARAIRDMLDRGASPEPHARAAAPQAARRVDGEIVIPRLGWNMDQGVFRGWLKRDGDAVAAGEPLFALETDKAVQEIESTGDGLLRIAADAPREGDTVPVGRVIGRVVGR
ncbi:MAG TPA: thiamine pyrophosphate-dependent enzyme [Burkholderiales bacterium]|nr:thiamine pyrophosphate-dependent enzyme [Burkholderiales bacterium]